MDVKFCNLRPDENLQRDLVHAYCEVMESGIYLNGAQLEAFEIEFAKKVGLRYCLGLDSGYDGLILSILALELKEIISILVPDWTVPLVWNSVIYAGHLPIVYSAANDEEYQLGIKVHLYGCEDTTELNCRYMIEDFSQAHGLHVDKPSNLLTRVYSFYPTKNLGGYGNAGCIVTDDYNYLTAIKKLAVYRHMNSQMDELQAAFLRVKMRYLGQYNERRKQIAQRYLTELNDLEWLQLPTCHNSVWHQFVIMTKQRDRLRKYLSDWGVETMIHYDNLPMFTLSSLRNMSDKVLSLPVAQHLTDSEVDYIIEKIRKFQP